eukprot:2939511-Karenia_brevis.AAC.1
MSYTLVAYMQYLFRLRFLELWTLPFEVAFLFAVEAKRSLPFAGTLIAPPILILPLVVPLSPA